MWMKVKKGYIDCTVTSIEEVNENEYNLAFADDSRILQKVSIPRDIASYLIQYGRGRKIRLWFFYGKTYTFQRMLSILAVQDESGDTLAHKAKFFDYILVCILTPIVFGLIYGFGLLFLVTLVQMLFATPELGKRDLDISPLFTGFLMIAPYCYLTWAFIGNMVSAKRFKEAKKVNILDIFGTKVFGKPGNAEAA